MRITGVKKQNIYILITLWGNNMTKINLYLSDELDAKLQDQANKDYRSKQSLIRKLIADGVK